VNSVTELKVFPTSELPPTIEVELPKNSHLDNQIPTEFRGSCSTIELNSLEERSVMVSTRTKSASIHKSIVERVIQDLAMLPDRTLAQPELSTNTPDLYVTRSGS